MLRLRPRFQVVLWVLRGNRSVQSAHADDFQTTCINKAASGVGCTDPTDFACQCKNTAAINSAALDCVLSGCGAQTGLAVQASASAVCDCVSSASASPQTSSAPATTPASTTSIPTAPGPVVIQPSSTAAATSAPYPIVSQASDGQVQATGTLAAPSNTASAGGASGSAAPFTGAGVKSVASIKGVLAALAGAIMML